MQQYTLRLKYTLLLLIMILAGRSELHASVRPVGGVIISPVDISSRGDSVYIELSVTIYAEAINARQSWSIIPRLVAAQEDYSYTLPYLLINGKVKEKHYKRRLNYGQSVLLSFMPSIQVDIPLQKDTVIYYKQILHRQAWMDRSGLEIHQVLTSPAGKEQLFTIQKIARIEVVPEKIIERMPVATVETCEEEQETGIPERQESYIRQGTARLDFPQGETAVLPFYGNNQEKLSEIYRTINEIKRTPGAHISSIRIMGHASPEGMYITNEELATGRANSFKNYLQREFGLPGYIFSVSAVAEDWDKLRELVEESHLYCKQEILEIIDRVGIFEGRELQLMLLDNGFPYRQMLQYMFPELRRVEYTIEWKVEE